MEKRPYKRRFQIALLSLLSGLVVGGSPLVRAQANSLPGDAQQGEAAREQPADSLVIGRVLDATGAAVVGAHVSLNLVQQPGAVTAVTGSDGSFSIAVPSPGQFHLEVTAHGFAAYQTSGESKEHASITLPNITLAIAAVSTEVEVGADSTQIAIQQVHEEEKQRILGVVPNYYISYNQDTAPLPAKLKFDLAWRFTLDPASFAIAGIIAGVRQANNTFSGYGQGAQGYGKRYAAAYGDFLTGIFISNAILPSVLKQDPRYFYKGTGSTRSRILYAIANSVVCKGDNGRWQTNYSSILGSLASGGISNAYYPAKNRDGAALTFENAATNIAATAGANLVQEFLFKRLTPHVPKDSSIRP